MILLLPLLAAGCATAHMEEPQFSSLEVEQLQSAQKVAEAAYLAGRYAEAMSEYTLVLNLDARNEVARLGVADCYLATGASKQASLVYDSLLSSKEPAIRAGAEQGRGLGLLMLGDLDAGRAQLREVVANDPSMWRSWNALGWSYDRERDWTAADDAYQRAVDLSPTPHVVLNNWGMSLLARGNTNAATGKFKRALEVQPDSDVARTNLQIALGLQGKYHDALSAGVKESMPATLNNVGYAAMLRGDVGTAEHYLSRAVEESPRFNYAAAQNLQYIHDNSK